MHKVPTKNDYSCMRHTWRECTFVFAGLGLAATVSAVSLAFGRGLEPTGPVWLGALAWTLLAHVAHVLWRGFRLGDWSAFRDYKPPDSRDRDRFDWSTRTGTYAYMRIAEENERLMRSSSL